MKKVLSLLLAYVVLDVQTWALSGGPVYTSGNLGAAVVGTYAGTLLPKAVNRIFQNPAFTGQINDANTLGLFILGIPASGEATGNFLFFQDGEAYFGGITGFVDPANGKLTALVSGVAATNNISSGVEFLSPVSSVGSIKAAIAAGSDAAASLRIKGTAFLQLQGYAPDSSPNGVGLTTLREDTFIVDGWKQANAVTNATITPPNTTSIPAPTTPAP